jgi:hypothetical protein
VHVEGLMVDHYSDHRIDISLFSHLVLKSNWRWRWIKLKRKRKISLLEKNTSVIHQQTSYHLHYQIHHNN